ncbi:hypothetical protein L9F63_000858, partial [Diploptera punctata]
SIMYRIRNLSLVVLIMRGRSERTILLERRYRHMMKFLRGPIYLVGHRLTNHLLSHN